MDCTPTCPPIRAVRGRLVSSVAATVGALALVLALAACGETEPPASPEPRPVPAPAREVEAPPASCPDGVAIDPPPAELEPGEGAKTTTARLNQLRRLMKRYPRSPKLRVEAASLSLGPPPAGNPVLAQKLLEEALALHGRGCRLDEALEWEANENLGLAHMLQGHHDQAAARFDQVAQAWPTVAQSHYDHACALCALDRIDECLAAFQRALEAASAEDHPEFVNDELTPYHFVHQARSSAELAKLRADPRFEQVIAPHLKQPRRRRRRR